MHAPAVALRAVAGPRAWDFALHDPQDEVVIGRGSVAGWRLDEPLLSRRHVHLAWRGGSLQVTDLGSRNGSRVNGRPLRSPAVLGHGDRIEIGPVTVTVHLLHRPEALTIGRPAGVEHTAATAIAPRARKRRHRVILPAAGAALLCLGLAVVPSDPATAPTPNPAPTRAHVPAAGQPDPLLARNDIPTGALRRDAIRALAEGRRAEAHRLFLRLAERAPLDRSTAVVLGLTKP